MPQCCRNNTEIIVQGKLYHEERCRICGTEWISLYDREKLEWLAKNNPRPEGENDYEPVRPGDKEKRRALRRHPSNHNVYL